MECSQGRLIYHKQTIVDENGVIIDEKDDDVAYKTIKVCVKKKTDQQGQTHVYTIRVVKKYGVQLKLF